MLIFQSKPPSLLVGHVAQLIYKMVDWLAGQGNNAYKLYNISIPIPIQFIPEVVFAI